MTPDQMLSKFLAIISDPLEATQAAFAATINKGAKPTLKDFALCSKALNSAGLTTDEAVKVTRSAWDMEARSRVVVSMPAAADIIRAQDTDDYRIIKKNEQWRAIDEEGDLSRGWSAPPTMSRAEAVESFQAAHPLATLLDSDE